MCVVIEFVLTFSGKKSSWGNSEISGDICETATFSWEAIGVSPEGFGTFAMLVNFIVSITVCQFTSVPPKEIQELVEKIRENTPSKTKTPTKASSSITPTIGTPVIQSEKKTMI